VNLNIQICTQTYVKPCVSELYKEIRMLAAVCQYVPFACIPPAFLSTPYHPEEEKQHLTPSTFWISPSIKVL